MVELIGTEKQVKWAEKIKAGMINDIKELDVADPAVSRILEVIENKTSALWFISNRTFTFDMILEKLMPGYKLDIQSKVNDKNATIENRADEQILELTSKLSNVANAIEKAEKELNQKIIFNADEEWIIETNLPKWIQEVDILKTEQANIVRTLEILKYVKGEK